MMRSMLVLWALLLSLGLVLAASGCSHPSKAGSADPHGPYTPEQARAAWEQSKKMRKIGPGGRVLPQTAAPGKAGGPRTGN